MFTKTHCNVTTMSHYYYDTFPPSLQEWSLFGDKLVVCGRQLDDLKQSLEQPMGSEDPEVVERLLRVSCVFVFVSSLYGRVCLPAWECVDVCQALQ